MKIYAYFALIGAALFTPIAASAAQPNSSRGSGHYEWRSFPRAGPYVGSRAPKRVWVADKAPKTGENCNMMKMSGAEAATCMKAMRGIAADSGSMMKMSSSEAAACMKAMSRMAAPSSSPGA